MPAYANPLPEFRLESFVTRNAAHATHNLSSSDAQTFTIAELLALAGDSAMAEFLQLPLSYSSSLGSDRLRHAIAATYTGQSADTVIAFAGAGEAIYALCHVLLRPGDHVLSITPNYQSHESLPAALCEVSGLALDPATDWALDLDALTDALRPNTKAVFLNYPHNPLGKALHPDDLTALVEICRARGIYLINDEVFRNLGPTGALHPPAVADAYEKGISINVMSKAYGLPGLRIGWIASQDQALITQLDLFKHYLSVCVATSSEALACVALDHTDHILKRNCQIIDDNLPRWQAFFTRHDTLFEPAIPEAGSIAFPRYLGPGGIEHLATRLREDHGIFIIPASAFPSALTPTPQNRFRAGFVRHGLQAALDAFDAAIAKGLS